MPQNPRPHRVQVKLSDDEYETLGARAAALDTTKSQVVRDALRKAPVDDATAATGGLTRAEALELLEESARAGSVIAQVALARELRLQPLSKVAQPVTGPVSVEELRRELRVVR